MKDVVLYSGGLDSFITYQWCVLQKKMPVPVYFGMKHRYQRQEMKAISLTVPETRRMGILGGLGRTERQDANIFARNAYLILSAAGLYEEGQPGTIWLTVQQDEMSIPDRSPEFFTKMRELLRILRPGVEVDTPWQEQDKADMVKWYLKAKLPKDKLLQTHSCYTWGEGHCGECAACVRRYIALTLNDLEHEWIKNPVKSEMAEEYRRRARNGEYSKKRCQRILEAL